ncbi:MAG: hypothetical protein KDD58_04345 [Bdellovibrionales bacterium]|nr:hypothetical protein [Bdellovibrionales bacterium]
MLAKTLILIGFFFSSYLSKAEWETDKSAKIFYKQQYFIKDLDSTNTKSNYATLELEPKVYLKKSSALKINLEPYFYHKFSTVTDTESSFFDASQSYIESSKGNWRLRLGSQIHNWGVLDLYSPADVVNTSTLYDPLDPKKLGAVGLDLTWSTFGKKWQLLYLPIRRPTQFPEENSRWLPRQIITGSDSNDINIYLPQQLDYQYDKSIELDNAFKNNFGTKFSFTLDEWDWNIIYFYGLSTLPQMEIEATVIASVLDPKNGNLVGVNVEPEVVLRPIDYLQETIATSLVWAPDWGIWRWETSYLKPKSKDFRVDQELLQSALGFEKSFFIGTRSLLAQIQYFYSEQKNKRNNLSGTDFQLFDDSVVLSGVFTLNDNNSLYASELYNFNNDSTLSAFGGLFKINDMFKLEMRALVLNGPEESVIGTYKKNDLAEAKLHIYY